MDVIIMDMGPDVQGGSALKGFEGKTELLSFAHGVAMQVTGDGGGGDRTSGRPMHQDMSVTKYLDATSPVLLQRCCEGKAFPQVDIVVGRRSGDSVVEVMRYTLGDVLLSTVSVSGGGGAAPVESLTLNYTRIDWRFRPPEPRSGQSAVVRGGWDLAANKPRLTDARPRARRD